MYTVSLNQKVNLNQKVFRDNFNDMFTFNTSASFSLNWMHIINYISYSNVIYFIHDIGQFLWPHHCYPQTECRYSITNKKTQTRGKLIKAALSLSTPWHQAELGPCQKKIIYRLSHIFKYIHERLLFSTSWECTILQITFYYKFQQ